MNDPKEQAAYSEIYNSFDKNLVDHIPKKLPNNQIGFGFYSPENNGFGQLHLSTKISSKSEFLELKTKLSGQALFNGFENDKCFAVIDGFRRRLVNKGNFGDCKIIFPIPQESILYAGEFTSSNINSSKRKYEDAEIIIKEHKEGDFLTIIDSDESIKSKSGFSKGYTFVEKDLIIIYWTLNW